MGHTDEEMQRGKTRRAMRIAYDSLPAKRFIVDGIFAEMGGLVLSPPHFSDDKWQWTCDLYFAGPMWKPWALKDVAFFQGSGHTSPPRFSDVVECLLLDALGVVDTTFEGWANEYGYSADSIKARDIYLACVNTRARLAPVMRDYEQMQHAQPDLDVESYCHNQWATLGTYQR